MSAVTGRPKPMSGNIVFLNGASSSGKSAIAAMLQQSLDGYYLHSGIDHFLERVPRNFNVSTNDPETSPSGGILWVFADSDGPPRVRELRWGAAGLKMAAGMYRAAVAYASVGDGVIFDDVIFDPRVLREAVDAMRDSHVLFVGVRCPVQIAERRERERGDRVLGLARAQHDVVHTHGIYDLELDTSELSPTECAARIKERLENGPPPSAFERLRATLLGD